MRELKILDNNLPLRESVEMLIKSDDISDLKICYNILLHNDCEKNRQKITKINMDSFFF